MWSKFVFSLTFCLFISLVVQTTVLFGQNLENKETYTIGDTVLAQRLVMESMDHFNEGDLTEVLTKIKIAETIYHELNLNEDSKYLGVLYLKGRTLIKLGRSTDAKNVFEHLLNIRSRITDEKNQGLARIYYHYGIACKNTGDYEKAVSLHEESLDLRRKILPKNDKEVIDSYGALADDYRYLELFEEGLTLLDDILEILKEEKNYRQWSIFLYKKSQILHDMGAARESMNMTKEAIRVAYFLPEEERRYHLADLFVGASVVALDLGDIPSAIEYNVNALALFSNDTLSNQTSIAYAYYNLGLCYSEQLDYQRSIEYSLKALNILKRLLGESHPTIAVVYSGLGSDYVSIGEQQLGIEFIRKATSIRQAFFGDLHVSLINSYNTLSNAYNTIMESDSALIFANKALEICQSVGLQDRDLRHAAPFYNLGIAYKRLKRYTEAVEAYQRSLWVRNVHLGALNLESIGNYAEIGTCLYHMGKYDQALVYYDSAAICLKQGQNYSLSPEYDIFLAMNRTEILLKLYEIREDISFLESADSLSTIVASNINRAMVYQDGKTRQNIMANFRILSEKHLRVIHELCKGGQKKKYPTLFQVLERSRSATLLNALRINEAHSIAGIPDSLVLQEQTLRTDITFYEKKRRELLTSGYKINDQAVLAISSKLFDLNRKIEALATLLESNFPKYFEAKYDLTTASLNYVQDTLLQPNQSLIEYFLGDSSLFIFLVQPQRYEVQEIPIDSAFRKQIEFMTSEGIYGNYALPKNQRSQRRLARTTQNYALASHQLYQKLITPVKDHLPKDSELIIVPDGALGYIPFEALLAGPPINPTNPQSFQYLLQEYQISYAYSATLLREMRDRRHQQAPEKDMLAMAPFFLEEAANLVVHIDTTDLALELILKDSLAALPGSGPEVKTISKSWRGDAWYGPEASIERFREWAPQYRILHLSTHGQTDDRGGDYAFLAFGLPDTEGEFVKLYARDLYNLSLNADMVFLSACETAAGNLQRGEGIVSLARAFAYAGAKSMITTLWKVEEKATAELSVAFYKYLKKGRAKDQALRLAKLEFLKKHGNDPYLTHPFFWAGMIGIGDMRPVR